MNSTNPSVQLIECPRDSMQGWKHFIPTEKKIHKKKRWKIFKSFNKIIIKLSILNKYIKYILEELFIQILFKF